MNQSPSFAPLLMCVCASTCVCVCICNHYCRQISSIHTASIHHHLPLTFLIAIDLFARHKYLCWDALSQVYTHACAHTRRQTASNLFCSLSAWLSSGANVINSCAVLSAACSCPNVGQYWPGDGSISPRLCLCEGMDSYQSERQGIVDLDHQGELNCLRRSNFCCYNYRLIKAF